MAVIDKPLVWLHGEIKSPPLSSAARLETGLMLRRLRNQECPIPAMPSIGPRCHELRINDDSTTWRIVYRIDTDAIVLVEVFAKKTMQTPKPVIDNCKRRLRYYDND